MFSFLFALASFGREASNADVAQWKEAAGLGSAQYGFESLHQHQRILAMSFILVDVLGKNKTISAK